MTKAPKPKAKTLAELKAENEKLTEGIDWAKKIIPMQQMEVDRLIKQVESLTQALSNISRWERN